MAINLSKLNISLDTFNAESSGTYNIGQMKLSSDGKSVYRTNNHKTFTILNRTEISSEEALGIYEVAPEDFALAEFVDSSKLELQRIVREGLNILRKENA